MRKTGIVLCLLLLLTSVLVHAQKEKMKGVDVDPGAELMASIERGKALFNDTKLGTSGMSCSSCHVEGGTKDGKMGDMTIKAFHNMAVKYPKYFPMAKKVMTLDQVNNFCLVNPLKGEPFGWNDQRMADLTAYVASVKAAKMGKKPEMEHKHEKEHKKEKEHKHDHD
jgi:cytochrome c